MSAGCGTAGASDLNALSSSIREVEQRGAAFTLTVTERSTGGDIPKGKYAESIFASSGVLRDDNAALVLGTKNPATGMTTADFDLVVNDSNIFVRPHASTRDWYTSWTFVAEEFIPGVRLNLVRETALLASNVNRTTTYSNGAFLNQFTITPATDQLKQLMSVSNTGKLTASLSNSGGHLQGISGHFTGTDSASGRHLVIDSVLSISKLGRAATPQVPGGGVAVQPADLFSTATTG